MDKITDSIKWDARGLVPVVVQDERTKEVVMVAYMNAEALELTRRTGRAHYYSRSRGKLWLKGETSGHYQEVRNLRLDCDGDTLLLVVDQRVAACHTGYFSCFYRTWKDGWTEVGEKVFDEEAVYGDKG
ncbi:MAG: phosphoribosyl-AMP cyclohydrolase [Syntrophorhabdales bacterium]|jgi:phosphoribosyl-ATP pyrophosphohydrolase/phosphoribosyl-AMP cyclohydrolase